MRVAFLFDNDGVLIDSSDLHWQSWELLMEQEPNFKIAKEAFVRNFGKRNDLILADVAPSFPEQERNQWAERKEQLFRECASGQVSLLPGMEDFLKKVVKADIPHIIASSTPIKNLEMFLATTVLGQYFDQFVSAEEVEHGKPAPDVFIAAAERLGFDPKECVVFEDSPAGLAAGRAAGCFVVALETSHSRTFLTDYDQVYPSPRELDLQEILKGFSLWKDENNS